MSSCSAEDGLKATAFLTDALFDQEAAHSYKPEHAPVSHAYDRPIFDFFAAPGNEAYLKRFGMAMYAINSIMQGEATLATGAFSSMFALVYFRSCRTSDMVYVQAILSRISLPARKSSMWEAGLAAFRSRCGSWLRTFASSFKTGPK